MLYVFHFGSSVLYTLLRKMYGTQYFGTATKIFCRLLGTQGEPSVNKTIAAAFYSIPHDLHVTERIFSDEPEMVG